MLLDDLVPEMKGDVSVSNYELFNCLCIHICLVLNDNKYICEYNSINFLLNNLNHSVKNEYDLKTKNIKREDIRRVINKYFNKNNLTLCILSNKTITEQQIIPYINNLVL